MIRFKCIYCGQRILAPDDGTGKKGKCPKCNHLVVVPKTTKGRPAINADVPEQVQQVKEAIAELSTAQDTELQRAKVGWLIPTYDELSIFLLAATFLLIYLMNGVMRKEINAFIRWFDDPRVFFYIFLFVMALGLCLYHVFTPKEKTQPEKTVMLAFAVVTNGCISLVAAKYTIEQSAGWLLVFPAWNAINSVLLLLMWRFKIIDEECISDRDANTTEAIIGLTAVLIIFILCNYVFKLYWAITFSICIIYATSFDKALQSVFPGLSSQNSEHPDVL